MNLIQLEIAIFDRAEACDVEHMAVGAIAAGTYGIPRATKDIDLLVSVDAMRGIKKLITALGDDTSAHREARLYSRSSCLK